MEIAEGFRDHGRKLALLAVIVIFLGLIFMMFSIESPKNDHEWSELMKADRPRELHLSSGDYEVWVEEDRDPGTVQIEDGDRDIIFSGSSEDREDDFTQDGVTYYCVGKLALSRSGDHTIHVEKDGMVYISEPQFKTYHNYCCFSLLFLVAFAVAGVKALNIYNYLMVREHSSNMADVAEDLDLEYFPADPYGISAEYSHLDLFRIGKGRKAQNILAGVYQGHKVLYFDYVFFMDKTKQGRVIDRYFTNQKYWFSGLIIELPRRFPELTLRPESLAAALSSKLGPEDIEFDNSRFSRKYLVRSSSKKFAYDVFHPRMMELFLKEEELFFELEETTIIIYWEISRTRDIPCRLDLLVRIKELLPPYLFSDERRDSILCHVCGQPTQYIPDYEGFFCWTCEEYLADMEEQLEVWA